MVSTRTCGSCRYLFVCSTLCWDHLLYQACIWLHFSYSRVYIMFDGGIMTIT